MQEQFDKVSKESGRSEVSESFNYSRSSPSRVMVQAQLQLSHPADSDELEADLLADSIINEGKIVRSVSKGFSGGVAMPSHMGANLAAFQGSGSRLYGGLKEQMEQGFGRDFSDVRLHTDSEAASMSESISARAFTYGNDIYFNRGQFNPQTKDGQHLLAHELAHVIQQTGKVNRKEEKNQCTLDDDRQSKLSFIRTYTKTRHPASSANAIDEMLKKDRFRLFYKDPLDNYVSRVGFLEKIGITKESAALDSALLGMIQDFPQKAQDLYKGYLQNKEPGDKDYARTQILNYRVKYHQLELKSKKIIDEASEKGRGDPVHVAIMMDPSADHNGASLFLPEGYLQIDRLILLRWMEDIKTCTQLLKDIDEVIGPIRNLIICGHGEYILTALNSNHSFSFQYDIVESQGEKGKAKTQELRPSQDMEDTIEFFKVVGKLMPEEHNITKRIILMSCLTNSFVPHTNFTRMNFSDSAFSWTGWKNRQNFLSPKASVSSSDIELEDEGYDRISISAVPVEVDEKHKDAKGNNLLVQMLDPYLSGFYLGPLANEPIGHIRGIAEAYYFTGDILELKKNLEVYDAHFKWGNIPRKEKRTVRRIRRDINRIKRYIADYLERKREGRGGLNEIYFKILLVFNSLIANNDKYNAMNKLLNYKLYS